MGLSATIAALTEKRDEPRKIGSVFTRTRSAGDVVVLVGDALGMARWRGVEDPAYPALHTHEVFTAGGARIAFGGWSAQLVHAGRGAIVDIVRVDRSTLVICELYWAGAHDLRYLAAAAARPKSNHLLGTVDIRSGNLAIYEAAAHGEPMTFEQYAVLRSAGALSASGGVIVRCAPCIVEVSRDVQPIHGDFGVIARRTFLRMSAPPRRKKPEAPLDETGPRDPLAATQSCPFLADDLEVDEAP